MKTIAYSIKCWLTSVLLGSIGVMIYFAFFQMSENNSAEITEFIYISGVTLLYSFLFSIPAVIIFSFLNWVIHRFTTNKKQFRIVASIVSAIIWFILVFLFFGNILNSRNSNYFLITLPYLFGLLFGIWKYHVEFSLQQISEDDILDTPF